MAVELGISPDVLLNTLAGLVMLSLAAWLLYLDRRSRVNLAFALFLALRGLLNVSLALFSNPSTAGIGARVQPAFNLAVPFAALAFAFTYRNTYATTRHPPFPAVLFLAAGVAAVGLYVAVPRLWFGNVVQYGPLFLIVGLTYLSYAFVALMMGYEYIRAPSGPVRRSLLLVSLAFALAPTFVAMQEIAVLDIGGTDLSILGPFFETSHLLADLSLVPIVALLVLMVMDWKREEDARVRPETMRYVLMMLFAMATAIAGVLVYYMVAAGTGLTVLKAFEAVWDLSLPLIITYALLRHQLFDINIRVKEGVRRGAVAGSFGFVFFISSETLELFVPVDSDLLGIMAAGVISLMLAPIQRFAQQVADRLLPGVKPFEQMTWDEQVGLYRDQVKIAMADGELTDKDRKILDVARQRLDLPEAQARRVEEEVRAQMGEQSAAKADPPAPES